MQKTITLCLKKSLSVLVALTIVLSMFTCLYTSVAFADDTDSAPKAAETEEQVSTLVTPVKASLPSANEGETHKHKIIVNAENLPAEDSEENYDEIEFTPLYQDDVTNGKYSVKGQLPTQGSFYLAEDITLTVQGSPVYEQENIANICLNGHTVTAATKKRAIALGYCGTNGKTPEGKDITYGWDQTMNICDCSAEQTGLITRPAEEYNVNGSVIALLTQLDKNGVQRKATLNFYSGTISAAGTTTGSNGGAVSVSTYGDMNIFGGTIIGATVDNNAAGQNALNARYGGSLYTDGLVNMYGGVIKNGKCFNTATEKTAAAEHMGGNVGISAASRACFNMYAGVIKDGVACDGGNVAVVTNTTGMSKFNMYGGTVSHGHVDKQTYVKSGTPTTTGGNGGNMWFGGKALIAGGEILDGEASNDGGQILLNQNSSDLTITGGYINKGKRGTPLSDNASGSSISMPTNTPKLTISGNPTILGSVIASGANTRASISGKPVMNSGQGLFFGTGQFTNGNYTFSNLEDGADINITMYYDKAFQEGAFATFADAADAARCKTFFHSSNKDYSVVVNGANLELVKGRVACVCGGNSEGVKNDETHVCADQVWTGVESITASTAGYVYLTKDVTISSQVTFTAGTAETPHEVHIDLNGHKLKRNGGRMFSINNGYVNFSICDSVGGGSVVLTHSDFTDSGIFMFGGKNTSSFALYGGTVDCSGVTSSKLNVGQVIHGDFKVKIYGGTITGGTVNGETTVKYADGVNLNNIGNGVAMGAVRSTTDIFVYGGTINGCDVTDNGVGFAVGGSINCGNNFYMYGGTVQGGKVTQNGEGRAIAGNIFSRYTAYVRGGVVKDGVVTAGATANNAQAGNIHSSSGVTVENATVKDGKVISSAKIAQGGNIFAVGTVNLNNATVSGGSVDTTSSAFKGADGAYSNGGNIYAYAALNITDSTVENGYINAHTGAYGQGGNIYARAAATISGSHINNGTIESDSLYSAGSAQGGNVYFYQKNSTVTDTEFLNGTARSGGSICVGWGSAVSVTMTNCQVSGAKAYQGGAVAVWHTSTLTANNCIFTGCEVDQIGGTIFLTLDYNNNKASVDASGNPLAPHTAVIDLTDCTVKGGSSKTEGGNIGGSHPTAAPLSFGEIRLNGKTVVEDGESRNSNGGNIYLPSNATLYIHDGVIVRGGKVNNSPVSGTGKVGPNLYIVGKLIMDGGLIDGTSDVATCRQGGTLYVNGSATYEITGGTFRGGYASLQGGNLWLNGGDKTGETSYFKNVTIENGKSDSSSGNVFVYREAYFEDCVITGGAATSGGNIAIYKAWISGEDTINPQITLVNTQVKDGSATSEDPDAAGLGGNMFVDTGSVAVLSGTTSITNGTSHREVPGIYNNGTMTATDSVVIEDYTKGSNVEGILVLDKFSGSVTIAAEYKSNYGVIVDADVATLGNNVNVNNVANFDVSEEEAADRFNIIIFSKAAEENAQTAYDTIAPDDKALAAEDISNYETIYDATNELTNQEKALLEEKLDGAGEMITEAKGYKDMLDITVAKSAENVGEGKTKLVFFTGVDALEKYSEVSISITMNGVTKIYTGTTVYTSIVDADGETVLINAPDKSAKTAYVFGCTLTVSAASYAKDITIFATLTLIDGTQVNGKEFTAVVGQLVDPEYEVPAV